MLIPGVHCLTLMSHWVWGKNVCLWNIYWKFTQPAAPSVLQATLSDTLPFPCIMCDKPVNLSTFGRCTMPFLFSLWRNHHSFMEGYICTFPIMSVDPLALYVAAGEPSQEESTTEYIVIYYYYYIYLQLFCVQTNLIFMVYWVRS